MEQFATEEQQEEAIKKFLKEYGPAILVGAVLGFGGLYGWRYYNDSQNASREQASAEFQQVFENSEGQELYEKGAAFANETNESGYATLASLLVAKQAVENDDLDAAAIQLQNVIDKSDAEGMKAIAAIRLARVQLQQQKLDDSLNTLALVEDEAFAAQVNEIKGDVYLQQKLFDKARAAYSAALEKDENNNLVKMKLDNLNAVANS